MLIATHNQVPRKYVRILYKHQHTFQIDYLVVKFANMGPGKLGTDFKTIKIACQNGHEVARYRKPRAEWGHRTHKLWLVAERINRLVTEPPILVPNEQGEMTLDIPELGTPIQCGEQDCSLHVGTIALVKGTVALELEKSNLKPTKG